MRGRARRFDTKPNDLLLAALTANITIIQMQADDKEDDDGNVSEFLPVEVDAEAYMVELRNEVAKLRDDLAPTPRQAKEESIRGVRKYLVASNTIVELPAR